LFFHPLLGLSKLLPLAIKITTLMRLKNVEV
jgi:hypothetical protein